MKLTIEQLEAPSAQDYIDLAKIWQGKRYLPTLIAPSTNEKYLFVARFNERLIAACWIHFSAQQALISDFTVREVTHRRGVGSYLLTQCIQAYPDITHWQASSLSSEDEHYSIADAFLTQHGFTASKNDATLYDYYLAPSR